MGFASLMFTVFNVSKWSLHLSMEARCFLTLVIEKELVLPAGSDYIFILIILIEFFTEICPCPCFSGYKTCIFIMNRWRSVSGYYPMLH